MGRLVVESILIPRVPRSISEQLYHTSQEALEAQTLGQHLAVHGLWIRQRLHLWMDESPVIPQVLKALPRAYEAQHR